MSVPVFHAGITDEMAAVLQKKADILTLLKTEHRPLSISMPQAAIASAERFKKMLAGLDLEARVHAAHKATASTALISALRSHSAIDVASEHELAHALAAGYDGSRIIATGPKSNRFLTKLLAVEGVTIIVDSLSELERLIALGESGRARILMRLARSCLNLPSIDKKSRFGLDAPSLEKALRLLQTAVHVTLKGIAFHLDSQSTDERRYAVQRALDMLLFVQRDFPYATILDIGGGYGTDYGVAASAGQQYEAAIKQMLAGTHASFTWQSRSFGVSFDGSRVRGALSGVDMPRVESGVECLRSILEHTESAGARSLAEQLVENLIELWIEPGSSVFSAAGLIAAEIIDIHERDGAHFVVVDAHRNQICFESNEHIADPILITDRQINGAAFEAYIVGHLCMENDFMMYRKVLLPSTPRVGDGLVWLHTGAYRSHFSASNAIGHPSVAPYVFEGGTLRKEEL